MLLSTTNAESRDFLPLTPVSRLVVHKDLRRGTAGTANTKWPKDVVVCLTPYGVMLSA